MGDVAGLRPLAMELPSGFSARGYYLGQGTAALDVTVLVASGSPSTAALRDLWKRRHGGTASPLLLVVLYPGAGAQKAAICGPAGDSPTVVRDLDPGNVERIATAALEEPNRFAATRFLVGVLGELESELPGLRNEGLFASHHLRHGVPARTDWQEACTKGQPLLKHRGRELVEALGFTVESRDTTTSVLRAGPNGTATAVAIFLDETETYEGVGPRFGGSSPVSLALAKADADRLPFVVITRGPQIRIYAADKRIVGVGRKGRSETYLEANLALLPGESAGYLPLLFGAEALLPEGSFEEILERSKNYASDLSKRLRERIYTDVVPDLATAIARRSAKAKALSEEDLRFLYEETLFILFRLVFIAYAEDKGLLPYATNDAYRQHALKMRAQHLAERWNKEESPSFDSQATDLWTEAKQLFRAVDRGHSDWGVPAYDGGLFSSDAAVSPIGAAIEDLELTNAEFGQPLASLLVDLGDEGTYGAIDFRSLSVREFGTIYEGLLESSLSIAQSDLTLDKGGTYVPAKEGDHVVAAKGEVYLHNQSGARKASGAYFTKEFAVEHLLDHALEPALDEHLERLTELLEAGDEAGAAEAFFDFRVADIAMGSGHFLVNAVDHIEARLTSFLTEHPLPGVSAELAKLRATALERLGEAAEGTEIEMAALVRRQVARRCVYGVDVNPIAVELARLALWIHTFVPGLPLSFLDRTLICGNSLTGIGTLEEAIKAVEGSDGGDVLSLARVAVEDSLAKAREPLLRLAHISDATPRDIAEARRAQAEAEQAVTPATVLFDLAIAARLGEIDPLTDISLDNLEHSPGRQKAAALANRLMAVHFPVAFPEVLMRTRPGFDCLVGNPPWDKVRFEAQQFWVTRFPGLKALRAEDQDRAIEQYRLTYPEEASRERHEIEERALLQSFFSASYQLQGRAGHHDYAKLFAERALLLLSERGRLGYVLPRQCLVLGGWSVIREALLTNADVAVLQARNRRGWLFDDVHLSYMIVLLTRGPKTGSETRVSITPAVTGLDEYERLEDASSIQVQVEELSSASETLVIPWFESAEDALIYEHIRSFPRLGSGEGWATGTAEANRWDFSGTGRHRRFVSTHPEKGAWRVLMAAHVCLFIIDENVPFQRYIPIPEDLAELDNGVALSDGTVVLADSHPRIVYRYPTMSTNSRTLVAASLPNSGFLPSKGYTHLLAVEDGSPSSDRLALLGYLCSYTCDWWVRHFVDRHMTKPVLEGVRLPNWHVAIRRKVARLTTALMDRPEPSASGKQECPSSIHTVSELDLRADIEAEVAAGLSLSREEMRMILWSFSDSPDACPPRLRDEILARMR